MPGKAPSGGTNYWDITTLHRHNVKALTYTRSPSDMRRPAACARSTCADLA